MEQVKNMIIILLLIMILGLSLRVLDLQSHVDGLEDFLEQQRNENAELIGELWIAREQLQKDGGE